MYVKQVWEYGESYWRHCQIASFIDYLHPPMATQDEESLFSTYLHPPMAIPEDNSHMDNSHMFSNNFSGNHDSYDNNMRVY